LGAGGASTTGAATGASSSIFSLRLAKSEPLFNCTRSILACAKLKLMTIPRLRAALAAAFIPVLLSAAPMPLHDKVAQLVVMSIYGEPYNVRSHQFKKYQHLIRDVHIGGVIVTGHSVHGAIRGAEPYAFAALINRLQSLSPLPLFVAADFERGASMRIASTTAWPYSMAFAAARDLEGVRYQGAETAREARAIGVNWLFAPVADVNNNPDNPIINIRSYGENAELVASYVSAYIEGAHSAVKDPVLVTAKHFPGHGDTVEDSHMQLARLNADLKRIEAVELLPFRAAIRSNVDAIMTAHMAVPALEPDNIPATVSTKILTGVLRDELKFKGLIVTDAMEMEGLMQMFDTGEAAVRSLLAGADVLLMPRDAEAAIAGVVAAVQSGRLSEKRIDESLNRVLAAKLRLGLYRSRYADYKNIAHVLDAPQDDERAQQVADHAVTLVKDNKDLLPLRTPDKTCLIALTESRYGREGWRLMEEAQKRAPKMQFSMVDPKMSKADLDEVTRSTSACTEIVVAAYVSGSAYRGNVALPGDYTSFVNTLIAGQTPVLLAALGSPYLVHTFPLASAYLTTLSTTETSETAFIRALFGEIPITGRLPVTIPGIAFYGDGIQLPATKTAAVKTTVQ
jgi:beta-N-acetylhexosaminidase